MDATRDAFRRLRGTTPSERSAMLLDIADQVQGNAERIVLFEPLERGPTAHRQQRGNVLSYLELGRAEGARPVIGRGTPDDPEFQEEGSLRPAIFDGVRPDMPISRGESFGLALCGTSFRDSDGAIQFANHTDYGLAASAWSLDLNRIHRAVRDIEAKRGWVHHYHSHPNGTPSGGIRKAGSDGKPPAKPCSTTPEPSR